MNSSVRTPSMTAASFNHIALTVDMIHKISAAWKAPADLLVRPYKIKRAA